MKEFVGKMVEFVVQEIGAFKAQVVGDRRDVVLVKGQNDKFPRRIIKSKVVSFMPLEPVDDDVNLLVLGCQNPTINCPGVKFIKEGEGFAQNDLKVFMEPCPARCESCRAGSLGELRCVDGETLSEMMSGTMFGDYPEVRDGNEGSPAGGSE